MAEMVTVYPKRADAMNCPHPINGPMRAGGVLWTLDHYTGALLRDGVITYDESEAWEPPADAKPEGDPGPARELEAPGDPAGAQQFAGGQKTPAPRQQEPAGGPRPGVRR